MDSNKRLVYRTNSDSLLTAFSNNFFSINSNVLEWPANRSLYLKWFDSSISHGQFPPIEQLSSSDKKVGRPTCLKLLLMQHQGVTTHLRTKVPSAHFYMHELTDAHDWLVLLWLIEFITPHSLKTWKILLSWTPDHEWLWHQGSNS